jgi:hypothetical protein
MDQLVDQLMSWATGLSGSESANRLQLSLQMSLQRCGCGCGPQVLGTKGRREQIEFYGFSFVNYFSGSEVLALHSNY